MFKSSLELGAWGNPTELPSSKIQALPAETGGTFIPGTFLCSVCVGCCTHLSFKLLPTVSWHLPSASTRLKSGATIASDLQYPLEGVQGGGQE